MIKISCTLKLSLKSLVVNASFVLPIPTSTYPPLSNPETLNVILKSTSYPIKSAPLISLGYRMLLISGTFTVYSSTTLIVKSIPLSKIFLVSLSWVPSSNLVTISFCCSTSFKSLGLSDKDIGGKLDFNPKSFIGFVGALIGLIGLVIPKVGSTLPFCDFILLYCFNLSAFRLRLLPPKNAFVSAPIEVKFEEILLERLRERLLSLCLSYVDLQAPAP